ncbi:retrovirus-related pol polyprotein from transposon TNT 1-94 [Tanacetum coccineum]
MNRIWFKDYASIRFTVRLEAGNRVYVVPTGRVVVPTGRYVVPAGKVIIIVSPGRLSLVPTGRIFSLGKVKLFREVLVSFCGFLWEVSKKWVDVIVQHDRLMAFMDLIGSKRDHLITAELNGAKDRAQVARRDRYNQQEGIDFDETYSPIARLESIRILLAYACAHDFKLYQMDVKSAFLNSFINEEVFVAQPPEFIDFEKPNHVFKLKKALYGLKQASKAWYNRLKAFLINHNYTMGLVDNTLFTKKRKSHIIIIQIYVDDIFFCSTCQDLCNDFSKIMHDEFEMSMMGELNFFLGLQIKQLEDGIFFNQSKYVKEMLKKFGLEDSKPMKTPMASETKLTRDEDGEPIDDTKYRGMIDSLSLKQTLPNS